MHIENINSTKPLSIHADMPLYMYKNEKLNLKVIMRNNQDKSQDVILLDKQADK